MTLSMGNLFVLLAVVYAFGLLTTPLLIFTFLTSPNQIDVPSSKQGFAKSD